jgi:GNAT superfamily N-acetyltransferase
MPLRFDLAHPADASELSRMRTAVAERLTREFGPGHWSSPVSEASQASAIEQGRVLVARRHGSIVATFRLATKKPWAIDASYFTKVTRPLYLTDMAVAPDVQRRGIGRACMAEAGRIARRWPADAIRLDAYDARAGAGPFYEKCGLREMGRVVYRNDPLIYYEWLLADWPALEGSLS